MKVTKAVIPAAGLGTRVLPATKSMPKEMPVSYTHLDVYKRQGYLSSHNYETAFKTGLAAGSASAFQEWLASGDDIRKLLKTL